MYDFCPYCGASKLDLFMLINEDTVRVYVCFECKKIFGIQEFIKQEDID